MSVFGLNHLMARKLGGPGPISHTAKASTDVLDPCNPRNALRALVCDELLQPGLTHRHRARGVEEELRRRPGHRKLRL